MRLVILSDHFYTQYGDMPEILHKHQRPYYCVEIKIEGHLFAIPLRHHIRHPYSFITVDNAGLDYTKAVLIDDPSFVTDETPVIDTKEWNIIRGNEDRIFHTFRRYIRQYKRALNAPDNPRSQRIVKYSSLQYFEI